MLTQSIVPAQERLTFLPSITKHFSEFEATLFALAEHFSKEYNGGYWHFVSLDNGGKFVYPECGDESIRALNPYNQTDVTLSSEGFGICITLFALGRFNEYAHDNDDVEENQRLYTLYHQLRDYAIEHKDSDCILEFID
ncbi:antirestriction protein [Aliivibrio fischeri]|uniref:antirestriction protein n=1 Tax=Aliivibrio fischeri TaxID=668 RepID=UPI00080E02CE|nr:antirestriction protein [Aliivibrio fischeri]OCH36795.1 hypothetical protein A6E02_18815 [Aliivibrio fischeri]